MVVSGQTVLVVYFLHHEFILHDQRIPLVDDAVGLRLVDSGDYFVSGLPVGCFGILLH